MVETDILKYWYNMEFFSPVNPSINKYTQYMKNKGDKINWIESRDFVLSYDVYVGKAKVDNLIDEMIKQIGLKSEDKVEKDNASCCLCGFKVDDNKRIVQGSFSISPFMYAISKIINHKNINIDFKEEEIAKINDKINSFIKPGLKVTEQEIFNIYVAAMEMINLNPELIDFYCTVNCKKVRKRNIKKENDKQDDKTDILESFYAKDLKWVLKNAKEDDDIYNYIGSLNTEIKDKIEIESDKNKLKEVLNPNNYPMGKWPSIYKPSLMQQVAINLAANRERKNFSVNGPPGTGKTTLLKEIIASYVVDRAHEMCRYNDPNDAFKIKMLELPCSKFSFYYEIDSELADYGILVASNNNKAVENITIKLPEQRDMKQTMTNLFNLENEEDVYFTKLADNLLENKEKCWGLISARLGNKNNINKFNNVLWYDNNSLRDTDEISNWEETKQSFEDTYRKVFEYRKYISNAISDIEKYSLITGCQKCLQDNLEEQNSLGMKEISIINKKNSLEVELENQDEIIKDIKSKMNIFQKISNTFKTNKEVVEILNKKIDLRNKIIELSKDIEQIQENLKSLKDKESDLEEKVKECKLLEEKIVGYKDEFKENYVDDKFWENLSENPNSQVICPWTNNEYDKLREELFYKALKLQKAFVLNSRAVKHNLGVFANIASCSNEDKQVAYHNILNTIFLIVPVISTTFASVSNFLDGIQKEQLSTLIIDEAGQASPSSSVGAIWRFKKSIVVGDPLQVEPVITVPKEITKIFAEKYNVPSTYRISEISVQNLADNLNRYGGYRNNLWVGCPLTVHRRCISPMFDISNKIAYNGKMLNKTNDCDENEKLVLKKSIWLDVGGNEIGNKNHFVKEQSDKVLEIIQSAAQVYEGLPDIYIISPFKSVVNEIKPILAKCLNSVFHNQKVIIDAWIEENVGTVHTFQGKEAKEVILVLGCDKSSISAAKWAGKNVNLLNVAITRAKYRVAIIGDTKVWKNVKFFSEAIEQLKMQE